MKKTKKLFGIIMAAMLTATMLLGSFSASAEDPVLQEGTEGNPAGAYIIKEFNMAEGISITEAAGYTFTFTATLNEVDGGSASDEKYNDVKQIVKDIEYNYGEEVTDEDTKKDGIQFNKTVNLLDKVTFPHAGEYKYTVVEKDIGFNDNGYGLTCSKAEYNMTVYVKQGSTGTYIYTVTVVKSKDDSGADLSTATGNKVDPSNPGENLGDGDRTKFTFGNTLTKKGGSEGADNDDKIDEDDKIPGVDDEKNPIYVAQNASLVISKTVAGDYGDQTKDFSFKLTIKKSPTDTKEYNTITGYIYTLGISIDEDEDIVNINYNEEEKAYTGEFKLKHNQMLVFKDLPAGTRYTVTETAETNYAAAVQVTANGDVSSPSGAEVTNALVGEKDNYAKYTNTFDDDTVTPSGIIINNLPFIIMIVLAGAGIVFFVISRRRKYNR